MDLGSRKRRSFAEGSDTTRAAQGDASHFLALPDTETLEGSTAANPFWSERARAEHALQQARPRDLDIAGNAQADSAGSSSTELRATPVGVSEADTATVAVSAGAGESAVGAEAMAGQSGGLDTDVDRAPREADQDATATASAAPAPAQVPLGAGNAAQQLGMRPGERLIVEELKNLLVGLYEQNQVLVEGQRTLQRRIDQMENDATDKVVIHLFSGKTKTQEFGQWPSSVYVLSVDLEQGLDLLSDALYQYLLELSSSGKVIAIVGGPPCTTFSRLRERGEHDGGPRVLRDRTGLGRFGTLTRGEPLTREEQRLTDTHTVLYFRMFLLHHVAHDASEEGVCFVLENPMDPVEYLTDGAEHVSLWAWPEIKFLEREKGMFRASFSQGALGHSVTKPTTLLVNDWGLYVELHGKHKVSGGSGQTRSLHLQDRMLQSQSWAKWADGLTRAIGRAVLKWVVTPASERQRVMQVEQQCVRMLSNSDRAFIEHCEKDHLGYRRDCQTCLASSVRSHLHLRQSINIATLSL